MAVNLSFIGGAAAQFFDNSGNVLSGGKIYTYAAGTTTPQATYTSSAGTTPLSNPIILDAAGRVPTGEIWLTNGLQYKFILKTSTDVQIGSYDNIIGVNSIDAEQVNYTPPFTNSVATNVEAKLAQTVSVKDFGADPTGATDSTAAFQAALDSRQPLYMPPGTYLITDTLKLYENSVLYGDKTVAPVYSKATTRIAFTPATRRDVFNWASTPSTYVFGVYLGGFTVRGFGSLIDAIIDLPYAYGMVLDNLNGYAGFLAGVKIDAWLNCVVNHCNFSGFTDYGVVCVKTFGINATSTNFHDCYIGQGGIGVYATANSIWGLFLNNCLIETVDTALHQEIGNYIWVSDIYIENAPRTDTAGHQAIRVGLEGVYPGFPSGSLYINGGTVIGGQSTPHVNTVFMNLGACRNVSLTDVFGQNYGAFLATTARTTSVVISNCDWASTPNFCFANAIADEEVITLMAFQPKGMLAPNGDYWNTIQSNFPSIGFVTRNRTNVISNKLFSDASWGDKLTYRDPSGNFSAPIGSLKTAVSSGWTFNGAQLTPSEIVVNSNIETGAPALWWSTSHSNDVAYSIANGTSLLGSPIVTNSVGAYANFNVGDWVTASAGFYSATVQFQILAKASNNSSVTLDTSATVGSGVVTLATKVHALVPMTQQGYRTYAANPVGVIVPKYIGEELLRTDTVQWYKSSGLTSADWKAMT